MSEQLRCNVECIWFEKNIEPPTDFKFSCSANNAETVLQEGQNKQSLLDMWRPEVCAILLNSPCIAPKQQEIIPMKDRPYGGLRPH